MVLLMTKLDFPGSTCGEETTCRSRRRKRHGLNLWVWKVPWRRAWQSTPVFLPGESHRVRSLVGYSPVKVTQSCPTLSDPMDYTVHRILQARTLEWVAFPFSRGSSQPRDWTQVSHVAGGFFTSWVWLISILYPVIWTWKSELSVWNNYSNSIPCFP